MQVTQSAEQKVSGAEGTPGGTDQAGRKSAAPEGAPGVKGRKRKSQDVASGQAAPAEPSAGTAEAKPAKKKKTKAETPGQHAQQNAAAKPQPAAQKPKAPLKAEGKASKKTHVAIGDSSEIGPSGTPQRSNSRPAGKQTAQKSNSTRNGIADATAGAVDSEGDMEDDMSADEAADVADQAAQTAGGAASAKPKLTEEQRQERLQHTVFVGNLPAAVKAKRLKQDFSQYAPPPHSQLPRTPGALPLPTYILRAKTWLTAVTYWSLQSGCLSDMYGPSTALCGQVNCCGQAVLV